MFSFFKKYKQIKEQETKQKEEKERKAVRELYIKEKKDSNVPWFELIGPKWTMANPPSAPVSERYIWNAAFIEKLRLDGYTGETETAVIHDWEVREDYMRLEIMKKIERENHMKSQEPWVEIIGDEATENGVQLKLDWNPAFIKYLKKNGITGTSEAQIVDRWIQGLSSQVASEMHSERYED